MVPNVELCLRAIFNMNISDTYNMLREFVHYFTESSNAVPIGSTTSDDYWGSDDVHAHLVIQC